MESAISSRERTGSRRSAESDSAESGGIYDVGVEPNIEQFDEALDLQAAVAKVMANRWLLIYCMAVFTTAFAAVAFLATPIYRVATVIAPAHTDRDSSAVGIASTAFGGLASGLGLGPRDSETEEALAVLKSRQFTEDFIMQKNLLPRLFPKQWNPSTKTWKDGARHRPSLASAFRYFDRKVRTISQDPKSGLVTVEVDWRSPGEAADWANGLVSQVNSEMRARAVEKADASMQYLQQELRSTSTVEVRDAISHLIEVQVKQRMLAQVTPDYSFSVVDRAIGTDGEGPIWPKRELLLALGPFVGLVAGIGTIMLFGRNPAKYQ